ncbi:hypothetical protein PYCCODRAFT_1455117 [Trametes coccinea BRFM310]|uniref:CFEM domain-containing protein n=1 Tax=Trametes coccinea (strain BRFM310) TaxID=1353009 RepID=A0A1Y2I7E4_TRAC3|nr:hypothetical protein PYCCODRAFT_1455117 [Trametes coccinea BRFM310]
MPAPNLVVQQPRWVLLSAFLFLWSLSSGLRRDGPGRALGLGVDARAHLPVADNLVVGDEQEEYASAGIWKRQVGLPNCAALCASQASDTVGCGQGINLACACHSPSFLPDTVNCMDKNCTSIDEQLGQQALQSACEAVGMSCVFTCLVSRFSYLLLNWMELTREIYAAGTATSSASTTSASASSTSISSGPPPICTTGSPTTSATTTVSVTVTITSSASGSGSASSDSGSPTSTPPASSQSPSDTIPPDSTTSPPVTTVTSTSTLGSVPSSGTGGDAGTTGTGTGVGDGSTNGAAGSVSAPALGVVVLGSVMLWML